MNPKSRSAVEESQDRWDNTEVDVNQQKMINMKMKKKKERKKEKPYGNGCKKRISSLHSTDTRFPPNGVEKSARRHRTKIRLISSVSSCGEREMGKELVLGDPTTFNPSGSK